MLDQGSFYLKISSLLRTGQERQAEQELLNAYAELRRTSDIEGLKFVTNRLAQFYAAPSTEDLPKAEEYFLECEVLSPEAYTLLQTALFQFCVRRDFPKTIAKVDEIKSRWDVAHSDSYYSALTLKGEALVELGNIESAEHVLEEILAMARSNPSGLPHGDELNLLGAAIAQPSLKECSWAILRLIIPRIRSREYVRRAQSLLDRHEKPGTSKPKKKLKRNPGTHKM